MYESPNYPTSPADAERFVATQRHGTLIAVPPGGHPLVTLLPFRKQGEQIELHCVQEDPTFAAVRANPRVTFLVSQYLAFSPHDWVDARDAGRATLHFRAVAYEGEASTSTDPDEVAGALARLLGAYEPEAEHEPVRDGDFYGARLRRLAVIRIAVHNTRAKFKAGPAGPPELTREVAARLRRSADAHDRWAADELER